MPIAFLQDRKRAQRLGRVRLGVLVESKKDGKWWCSRCKDHTTPKMVKDLPYCKKCNRKLVYPKATPHFVLKDAPALVDYYGLEPASLNIEFLSENLEFTFPHYLRKYTAAGLRCLGDGVLINYRVDEAGEIDVRDGNATLPDGKVRMGDDNQPVKVPCLGDRCPDYISGGCKPTGFLRFLPSEAPRLGYYDVVCHQKAVVGIKTQLEIARGIFHHITGIPFILHRGEEEMTPVKTPSGVVDMPVRTQWLEIEPNWFAENLPLRQQHRALAARSRRQDTIDLFGETDDASEPPALVAPQADFEEPAYADEGQPPIPDGSVKILTQDDSPDPPPPYTKEELPYADAEARWGYPWHRRAALMTQLLQHPVWSAYQHKTIEHLPNQADRLAAILHQATVHGKITPASTDEEVYTYMNELANTIADTKAASED